MPKLILYLFALILCTDAKAQNTLGAQLKQAKFDIVKKTVEFLSTDSSTFKHVKTHTCANCRTFDDLKKFAADNELKNAGTFVIDPLANVTIDSSAGKWKESLNKFRQQAPEKITRAGKEKRKQLKGYNEYLASLNAIVENVKPEKAETGAVAPQQVKPGAAGLLSGPDTVTTEPDGQEMQVSDAAVAGEQQAEQGKSILSGTSPWLPYIISGILLVLFIGTWIELSRSKRKVSNLEYEKRSIENVLGDTKLYNDSLQNKIISLNNRLKEKEVDLQAAEKTLNEIQIINALPVQTETADAVMPEKPSTKPYLQRPKSLVSNKKYARFADMGDGFSTAELLDKPDNETIFELTIASNDTGEYRIINNPDAQKYALSNAPYFLGKTCLYNTSPSENASIATDSPGLVKLDGSKWIITNPAKITFS